MHQHHKSRGSFYHANNATSAEYDVPKINIIQQTNAYSKSTKQTM